MERCENQLLHSPIQQLANEELVLRRARDLVNPSELLGLAAGSAEHAQELAVERQLINPAWV